MARNTSTASRPRPPPARPTKAAQAARAAAAAPALVDHVGVVDPLPSHGRALPPRPEPHARVGVR